MSAIGELARRAWYVLNRHRFDRALTEEMNAHREMMRDPSTFGHTLRLREASRDTWGWLWVDDVAREIRLAARSLRRAPGFTIISIASLVLGLSLAVCAIAVTNAYLIRSLPYPDADRLYHVRYAPPGPYEPGGLSAIDWNSLRDVVELPITASSTTLYLGDGSEQSLRAVRVNRGFIDGLGIRPPVGRAFAAEEYSSTSAPVAMISYAMWRDRFASDSSILGKTLRAELGEQRVEAHTFRIVGVLPPGFWYGRESSAVMDVLLPLREPARTYMVRLREGVSVATAQRRITEVARDVATSLRPDWTGVELESVHERYVGQFRPILLGATVVAAIVLLIACTNVAVLVLLRALQRQKEMAVRVALGAGGRHIIRLLVAESGLLCGVAIALVLAVTAVTLRVAAPLIESQLGRTAPRGVSAIGVDPNVLVVAAAATVGIALSLCLLPLMTPWRRRLADMLRSSGRHGTDGQSMHRIRSTLIGFEIAGSLVLLVACGMMIRSVVQMVTTDLGLNVANVARVRLALPPRAYPDAATRYAFYRRATERAEAIANGKVALTSWPPFAESLAQPVIGDAATDMTSSAAVSAVGADYFSVLGIPVRDGRVFGNDDRESTEPVAVVSEALARRLWPGGTAVGRRIRAVDQIGTSTPSATWRTIVGVVGNVRQTYGDSDVADVYVPFYQVAPERFVSFYLKTSVDPRTLEASVRAALAETDPLVQFRDVMRVADENRQLVGTRFLTTMLTAFAAFAAFLSIVGIYGVIAYAVRQRRREFAIRVALGATRQAVTALSMRGGGLVLIAGIGVGAFAAAGAGRVLRNQLYGVPPFDVWSLVGAAFIMGAAGLLAIWWPARRAGTVDPVDALRED
jgi:putative ABC transport system permease protein